MERRFQAMLQGAKPEPVKSAEKKAKGDFFQLMIANAPKTCQECGQSLAGTMSINPAAVVCHILKKSRVKSVAENLVNIVYLCGDHHDLLDNGGKKKVMAMKIFPELKKRVKKLLPQITQEEKRFIQDYLLP